MWCPHCRQNAPIVYRGAFAYCTGCNRARTPFSAKALNLAGKPSKLGGTLGKVLGYLVWIAGLGTSFTLILLFHFLAPASVMGYAVGIPLAVLSLIVGGLLLYGSHRLHQAGSDTERETREQALYALAANRGGLLTSLDGARALGMNVADVESVLSDWAKRDPDYVTLEVDEEGQLFYLFSRPGLPIDTFGKRYRVEPEGRVRVMEGLEGLEDPESEETSDPTRSRQRP